MACEFSGRVRDAFLALGHDAVSCDIIPTESPGPHYQDDVLNILHKYSFDLMVAHPPCTYLSVSGIHWNNKIDGRGLQTEDALEFVQQLLDAPVDKIALENPVSIISTRIRKPDQIIQPYFFGHPESKATCLWLKNLPPLVPTDLLEKPKRGYWNNQTPSGQNKLGPSKERQKLRGITYLGVAAAMAQQWGT